MAASCAANSRACCKPSHVCCSRHDVREPGDWDDRPSALTAPGVAPAVDSEFRAAKKPDEICGTSLIASLAHVVSLIVPGWLLAIDAARVKVTVPKFASGTIVHRPPEVH